MEDKAIINLFFERQEIAISKLTEKYGDLCRTISYNILKNEQDVQECVNDTILAVWNTIPPQNPNPLQAYVCRIARNLSLKKYRTNTAQKRNSHYDIILDEIADCLESQMTVEEEVLEKELLHQLNTFLGTLKKKDRIIFVRRYWYCDSISDIADKMQMSSNAVTVKLHRIRQKLKNYIENGD